MLYRSLLIVSYLIGLSLTLFSQDDTLTTQISSEVLVGVSSSSTPALWSKANQYGTIPVAKAFILEKLNGSYVTERNSGKTKWEFSTEIAASLSDSGGRFMLPVVYGQYRYKHLEIYIGRKKEIFGLTDTLSGSGSYIWSGNALPIPKIQVGLNKFTEIPFTQGFIGIKLNFAHGWFGKESYAQNYYLHQKTMYLRFGKHQQKLKFYTGINHFAQWGGKAPVLIGLGRSAPDGSLPSSFKDFWLIFFAKNLPQSSNLSQFDTENRLGNHVGSIDFAFSLHTKKSFWLFYNQYAVENAPGLLANFPDGMYGISWKNNNVKKGKLQVCRISAQLLTLLDQGVFQDSRYGFLINDNFNNSQYMDGWTYRNHVIGTPFVTLRSETKNEWFNTRGFYVNKDYHKINGNYLRTYYLGMDFQIVKNIYFKVKTSYSNYYIYVGNGEFKHAANQFSNILDFTYLRKKTKVKFQIANDKGNWLENNTTFFVGVLNSLTK